MHEIEIHYTQFTTYNYFSIFYLYKDIQNLIKVEEKLRFINILFQRRQDFIYASVKYMQET